MLSATSQQDWSGGIYRGRRSPQNAVYDAVNVLLNDEGLPYRRGGSAFLSLSNAAETQLGLADLTLPVGQRVLTWAGTKVYVDVAGTPTRVDESSSYSQASLARPVQVGDFAFLPGAADNYVTAYAGTQLTAGYNTGTVSVTNGSAGITGSGTSWLTRVDPGGIFLVGTSTAVVKSVNSNTSITLTSPLTEATASGLSYAIGLMQHGGPPALASVSPVLASVGTEPRLIVCWDRFAAFSNRGAPFTFAATDFHELQSGARIIGAEGIGNSCMLFTNLGVWVISNMELDPVDDFGNIQHQVAQVNKSLVLWADGGIASAGTGLVVPALDDVFLVGLDGSMVPITGARNGDPYDGGIREMYRNYVKTPNVRPGIATMHLGHYLLPIVNIATPTSPTVVDVLVCRVDRAAAWTRWSGHAAGIAYTHRVGATASTPPSLHSLNGTRALDVTGCFAPAAANATEADGTVPDCTIITRDFPTGGNQPGTVDRIRGRYELTNNGAGSTPTVAVAFSSDQDAGAFTTLSNFGGEDGGVGGGVSSGASYSWWRVGKRRDRIRLRITQSGAAAAFVWRSLELQIRQSFNR